ncbi:hypothetical protein BDK51DRAFT_42892 [Blyttiomyces helicus]|uniref:Uncharacterized protein n=1 Tax=Blyttiomyces helicus TaxID=388810 RepID=A0A4P9WQ49_9FUNG|nr:hypothetical protein BDK51DRAFT_42892 [Blyttiomyces helicus]|eukprot:RKO94283.1 hypothetical protein BDK51DRAFT_42892 [Blyttiomyces helicus]
MAQNTVFRVGPGRGSHEAGWKSGVGPSRRGGPSLRAREGSRRDDRALLLQIWRPDRGRADQGSPHRPTRSSRQPDGPGWGVRFHLATLWIATLALAGGATGTRPSTTTEDEGLAFTAVINDLRVAINKDLTLSKPGSNLVEALAACVRLLEVALALWSIKRSLLDSSVAQLGIKLRGLMARYLPFLSNHRNLQRSLVINRLQLSIAVSDCRERDLSRANSRFATAAAPSIWLRRTSALPARSSHCSTALSCFDVTSKVYEGLLIVFAPLRSRVQTQKWLRELLC